MDWKKKKKKIEIVVGKRTRKGGGPVYKNDFFIAIFLHVTYFLVNFDFFFYLDFILDKIALVCLSRWNFGRSIIEIV